MSYLQFRKADSSGETSLELTREGLKIRSPVIGLIVLITSWAFFYLYLVNVYKMSALNAPSTQGTVVIPTSASVASAPR